MPSIINSRKYSNVIEAIIIISLLYMLIRSHTYLLIFFLLLSFLCIHIHQYIFCWRGQSRWYHCIIGSIQGILLYLMIRRKLYDISILMLIGTVFHIISCITGKSMLSTICTRSF